MLFCSVSRTLPICLWYLSCSPDVSRRGPVAWNASGSVRPIYNGCRPSFSPALFCDASHSAESGLGQLHNRHSGCISLKGVDIKTSQGFGPISVLTFDLEITVEPVGRSNLMGSTHHIVFRSPRGELVECGGIWKFQNRETGAGYFTLCIRDHGFNATWQDCKTGRSVSSDGHPLESERHGMKQTRLVGFAPASRRKLQS